MASGWERLVGLVSGWVEGLVELELEQAEVWTAERELEPGEPAPVPAPALGLQRQLQRQHRPVCDFSGQGLEPVEEWVAVAGLAGAPRI